MNNRLQEALMHFNRGATYSEEGRHDRAIADFDEAIKLNPDYKEAYTGRGIAYSQKGMHDCAIADFDKAIKLDPDYANAYIGRGIAYSQKGMHDYAIADLDKAIRLNPKYADAYNNRGVAYSQKDRHEYAIADFDEAIKLNPNYAMAYNNRGITYSKKGRHDYAIADFDEAIRLNSKYADAYTGRGIAYSQKGMHDYAIADFDKAIKLNPKYAVAYNNRGIAYSEKGRHDSAIADFNEAIRLASDYAEAYNNRGNTYFNKDEYDHAIKNYDEAIRLKPDYAGAYFNRGMIYFRKGKHDLAITDFLEADKSDITLKLKFPVAYLAVRIRNIYKENKNTAKVFELYYKLLSAVLAIQKDLFHKPPKDACSESFAHYTSLNTLKSLISKDSENDQGCFRLYNAAYMNDPEEGRVFFKMIKKYGEPKDIKDILYENDEGRSPTYIGSFVKIDKEEEDKDQLFLWRTYGKQDGQEAAGSCLIYKRVCFAERYPSQIGAMQQLQAKHDKQQKDGVRGLEERQNIQLHLYRIIYCNIRRKDDEIKFIYGKDEKIEDLPEKLKELANTLSEIIQFTKEPENTKQENELKGLASELLDSIRFLFKASHYSEEHEVRIIYTYYDQKDGEQEFNPIKVDTKQIPPRFYLETSKSFSFDEVILGPMVQRVPEWKRWIQQQKTAVKVQKSKIKYGKIY